ncbi:MAG: hypothetical protein HY023_16995 [Chloroflexi bacterium]|nr:hypothetical protein [Chloroflexota bacterium]MBI3761040.1 hypothetical protein [Chloroflexota bacterium]
MSPASSLHHLGRIVRLQIQPARLTLGEKPNRYYDPAGLLAVDEMTLAPRGALACLPDGRAILDVHHADHPQAYRHGNNALSVGFTTHYDAMRERFGDHIADGCAGENILVETDEKVEMGILRRGLAIRPAGSTSPVWLDEVCVAKPCEPFSRYASRAAQSEDVKAALQFLDNGVRGFYCVLAGESAATITVGDEVFWPSLGR